MQDQLDTTWEETRERPDTSKCSRQQNKLNKTLTNFRNTSSRGGAPSSGGAGILPYTEAVSSDRQQSRSGTRQGRGNIQQKQQDPQDTKASCFNMSGQGFFAGCEKTIEEGTTLDKYFGSGFQVVQVFGDEQEGSEKKKMKNNSHKKSQQFQQQQRLQQGSAQGGLIHETEEEYSESNKQSRVDLGVKSDKFESDQKQQQQEDFSLPTQESQRNSSLTKERLKRKDFSLTGEHAVITKKLRQKQLMKPSSNSSDRGNESACRGVFISKVDQLKLAQQIGQQQQQQQYPQCLRLNRQIVAAKQQQQQQPQWPQHHNQPIQNLSPLQDSVPHIKTQEAIPTMHKHNPSAVLNYQQLSHISDYNDVSFARRKNNNNSSLHQEILPKQPQSSEISQAKPSTPFSTSRRKQFYQLKSKPEPSTQGTLNDKSFVQPSSTSFLAFSKPKENALETEEPYDEWSASQNEKNGAQIMQETKGSSFLDACKGSSFMDAGKYSSYLEQSDHIDRTSSLLPAPSATQKSFSIRRVANSNNNASLHENSNTNNNQMLPYSSKVPLVHSPYIKEHQPLIGHSRKLSREVPLSLQYNSNCNPSNQSNQIRGGSMQQHQSQKQSYNYSFQSQGDCTSLNSCQQTETVQRKTKKMEVLEVSEAQGLPQQRVHSTSFYHPSNIMNTQEEQELSGEDLLRHYDNGYTSKNSQEKSSKSALNAKKIITKNSYKDAIQNTQLSEEMDVSMRRTAKENKFIGQKDKFKQIIKKQDAHFLAKYAARFNLNNRECNL